MEVQIIKAVTIPGTMAVGCDDLNIATREAGTVRVA
jgi:hypothetical protein